jgi:hypothetical protein
LPIHTMSESQDIKGRPEDDLAAPTPQNTPLTTSVLTNRPADLGKPHVEDVAEDDEEDEPANPASLLASVSRLLSRLDTARLDLCTAKLQSRRVLVAFLLFFAAAAWDRDQRVEIKVDALPFRTKLCLGNARASSSTTSCAHSCAAALSRSTPILRGAARLRVLVSCMAVPRGAQNLRRRGRPGLTNTWSWPDGRIHLRHSMTRC